MQWKWIYSCLDEKYLLHLNVYYSVSKGIRWINICSAYYTIFLYHNLDSYHKYLAKTELVHHLEFLIPTETTTFMHVISNKTTVALIHNTKCIKIQRYKVKYKLTWTGTYCLAVNELNVLSRSSASSGPGQDTVAEGVRSIVCVLSKVVWPLHQFPYVLISSGKWTLCSSRHILYNQLPYGPIFDERPCCITHTHTHTHTQYLFTWRIHYTMAF